MRESDIETYFKRRAIAFGGDVRKVKWIGRKGAPDRLALMPGRAFFIEFKAPGEPLGPHQQQEIALLRRSGQLVYVIDSKDKADEVLP
jgi:hypothetical protein